MTIARKHNHTHLHLMVATVGLLTPKQVIVRQHSAAPYIEIAQFFAPTLSERELKFYCQDMANMC